MDGLRGGGLGDSFSSISGRMAGHEEEEHEQPASAAAPPPQQQQQQQPPPFFWQAPAAMMPPPPFLPAYAGSMDPTLAATLLQHQHQHQHQQHQHQQQRQAALFHPPDQQYHDMNMMDMNNGHASTNNGLLLPPTPAHPLLLQQHQLQPPPPPIPFNHPHAAAHPQLLPQLPLSQIPPPPPLPIPAPMPGGQGQGLSAGYLSLDPTYPGLRLLHAYPPMYIVSDFLTPAECDALITAADGFLIRAPVVGAGNGELSGSRTSSTCYFAREDVPAVVAKACRLTGKPPEHVELPQVGRYLSSQEYKQHFDAFDLSTEDGRRFAENGGQRVATVLIYLNDVSVGGKTVFPRLNLSVTPTKGMALVFFPALSDGRLDEWALHAAEPAVEEKWVSQIWIRQGCYAGVPTRRITLP